MRGKNMKSKIRSSRSLKKQQKQKTNLKIVLKRFLKINRGYIPAFSVIILMIVLSKVLSAIMDVTIGKFFDYIEKEKYSEFYMGSIMLCSLQAVKLLLHYLINHYANYTSEKSIMNMRNHTYQCMTKASMRWLDNNKLGDIISRINTDLNQFIEVVNRFFTYQLANIIDFTVSIIVCFVVSWKLSLICFGMIPVIGCVQVLISKPIARLSKERSTEEGKANTLFVDSLGGIHILKAFGVEKEMYDRHEKKVDHAVAANIQSYRRNLFILPLQFFMSFLPMMLIFIIGSLFVIRGEITYGAIISFIMLSNRAVNIINSLSYQVREIYNAVGIADRIFDLWDVEVEDKGGVLLEKTSELPIRFEHVSFGYESELPILKCTDFTIQNGEKVALVGGSGAGKSTIIKLLAGFYEKTDGEIFIFGNKIGDWNKSVLREHMAYVGQDAFLFPGSILSNVLLARKDATEAEAKQVIEAVGLAMLDPNAEVGEGGANLSGGQRQRVCIARMLLKNADIVLLDEPTSALDTESEACVNAAFAKLMKNRTSIIIAHRLSAIQDVDRIICLKDGRIVEQGVHEELMRIGGVYYNLYEKQCKEETQYGA